MSCQEPLVRQQPYRFTCLFTLWKTTALRFSHPYAGRAIGRRRRRWQPTGARATMLSALMLSVFLPGSLLLNSAGAATLATPSRSTTIALTADETRLVVVNREANTVSIIRVKDEHGNDVGNKLDEIGVGIEPRCVAIHPNDQVAYVTNGLSGTVSVVDLVLGRVAAEVTVGTEPRGCALTPNGNLLYVANHTEGTVSILVTGSNPLNPILDGAVQVGRNPTAIAITNDGDGDDADETVFVTQIFAELNPDFNDPIFNGNGEARDLGKQGVVQAFPAGNGNPPITKIALKPLADSGFTANRVAPFNFCNTVPPAQSQIFCPNPADLADPLNTSNPQGVFPNQLLSALIRGNRLYLPNIGAQPEPPQIFNANVQALVYAVDTGALAEVVAEHVNLNKQIEVEPAAPPPSLDRTFGNDLVAIDANLAGDTFLIVSRGGNQVFRATLDADNKLDILNAAKSRVDCRVQTGNLPSGVAMRQDGTRGYANNEANFSVTSMNVDDGTCLTLQLDIDSSTPPAPGELRHAQLLGKIAFFTALGIPDNGILDAEIRDIIPRFFRGKQSKDAWSSCGSCHPDGLADGVTWIFGTGPRQTKPLDAMFSKFTNMSDAALLNWSAIRGSNTDFNANSRATQGGCGFASVAFTGDQVTDPPDPCTNDNILTPVNPAVYDHGITQGASEALDVQTLWIFFAVRALNQPQVGNLASGATVFNDNCASCHGGAKWTKSQIFHRDNPAAATQNGPPLDQGVTRLAPAPPVAAVPANEFFSFTCNNRSIKYLEDVGTFDSANPLEIRDNAAASLAFGVNGFNVPSLLSVNYHAPYLHRGQAQTLDDVFALHGLGAGASGFPPTTTIATELTAQEQADLLVFLKAIDGTTDHLRSEGDVFRDTVRAEGTCQPASVNDELEETEISSATDLTPIMGFVGTLTLVREFCNIGPNTLTLLQSQTTILTAGNALLNRDGGTPAGVGSVVTFPSIEGFADRLLGPNECVPVTYSIGLVSATADVEFFVDVLGGIVEPVVTTTAQTAVARGKGGSQPSQSIQPK